MVFPLVTPVANSKPIVSKAQHIPISQQSLEVVTFVIRGNNNHVIRKIHTLNIIPLAGNAHSSPSALTNTYSRSPPLRIAAGMKHNQIIRDFRIFIISWQLTCV